MESVFLYKTHLLLLQKEYLTALASNSSYAKRFAFTAAYPCKRQWRKQKS